MSYGAVENSNQTPKPYPFSDAQIAILVNSISEYLNSVTMSSFLLLLFGIKADYKNSTSAVLNLQSIPFLGNYLKPLSVTPGNKHRMKQLDENIMNLINNQESVMGFFRTFTKADESRQYNSASYAVISQLVSKIALLLKVNTTKASQTLSADEIYISRFSLETHYLSEKQAGILINLLRIKEFGYDEITEAQLKLAYENYQLAENTVKGGLTSTATITTVLQNTSNSSSSSSSSSSLSATASANGASSNHSQSNGFPVMSELGGGDDNEVQTQTPKPQLKRNKN
ncbi:MAG: hypothetical protein KIT80_24040 [Chitinophagaceae bacterium]|nr:hypothetical protein [Chitinophagaceae bacterium]